MKDIGATNYPDAVALWDQTGNFIGTALPRMERGKAFSIMLGRRSYVRLTAPKTRAR